MEVNIIYYTSIYLFSGLISFFLLSYILPAFYKTQKTMPPFKKRKIYWASSLLVLTIILGTIFFSIIDKFESKKNQFDITETINELSVKADIEILKNKEMKEKKILSVVQEYFIAHQSKNINRIDTFYSFPVVKFYKFLNVSKEKLNERTRFEWRHKTYPLFIVNPTNTTIKSIGVDSIKLVIKQIETENSTIFLNIKLNKELKIFSISNSILTNYYENDELDSVNKKNK